MFIFRRFSNFRELFFITIIYFWIYLGQFVQVPVPKLLRNPSPKFVRNPRENSGRFQAEQLGLGVILDGVFNICSRHTRYLRKYLWIMFSRKYWDRTSKIFRNPGKLLETKPGTLWKFLNEILLDSLQKSNEKRH